MVSKKDLDGVWKHIGKINDEMGDIETKIATIQTDVCWLKKEFSLFKKEHNKVQWLIFSSVMGTLIILLIKSALGV